MEFRVQEVPFLEEVYRPPQGQRPEIDLVFVHGLNPFSHVNHAFDTWTHDNGTFWPYQFLPDDIPEARIWVYGYNSNIAREVSEAGIKDHADVLLDRLQRKRKQGRKHGTIPIIFIGHSLGGLVIKQALLNAKDNEFYEPTRSSTFGLVFFGTPHRGERGGAFGSLAANIAKFISEDRADNDLLACLENNSLFTQEASERFSHQLEKYKVISFFETLPMTLGVRGVTQIVVDRQSAILELGGSRERREALNATHSTMCKLGSKGPMYDGIVGKIKDMVDEALDTYEAAIQGNMFLNPGSTDRGRSLSAAPSPIIKTRTSSPILAPQAQRNRASSVNEPLPTIPPVLTPKPVVLPLTESARVLFAYQPEPQEVNDIELTVGDVITNIDRQNPGWWFGSNSKGQSGIFPSNYVEILPPPEVEQLPPPPRSQHGTRPSLQTNVQESSVSLPAVEKTNFTTTGIPSTHRELGTSLSEADLSELKNMVVHGASCDNCEQQIRGIRHKCMECPDWDYCSGCIRRAPFLHNPAHHFQPIYEVQEPPQPTNQTTPTASRDFSPPPQDTLTESELAKQVEYLANTILLSSLIDASKRGSEVTPQESEVKEIPEVAENPEAVDKNALVAGIALPTRMVIPQCSVCKGSPESFPVLTCNTCWGKTIVCQNCAATLQTNPSNPHKNHKLRTWVDGLWYDGRHIFMKTLEAPSDQYGLEWRLVEVDSINLGYNAIGKTELIEFPARPAGNLRIALLTVPPGQWEISLQISTWPSPNFKEPELKLLRFSKKLSVQANTTSLGFIDCYLGAPIDGLDYLGSDTENPLTWHANSVRHPVGYGTLVAQKIKFPLVQVVGDKREIGIYLSWLRNSDSFTKEKPEVQARLGFCWRLEGIKLEAYSG